ncbi:hypothetical protein PPTG_09988 [Phytophthora nicotianae INRA-310]|uniref:Uncharacterized protein n=1 Tax=Phytophthora nicotianae (strain INRA-310) TaxID=761204 RepID=W2QEL3_PHYN3|nr:hypothetical protein PPTG_09988 [Phytophthora nicotianae INRA-310]ETN10964.1 hypothetical protein PPTG_09988 [Phytophthora nicotianae INRA-310]
MQKETFCRCQCRNIRETANRSGSRWLPAVVTVLMLVNVATATSEASSSGAFVMDGATTYCWEVDTSIYSNTVDGSSVKMVSAQGDGCPLKLSIAFPTGDVYAYDSVDISWNATERLAPSGSLETNTFGLTELAAGLDRISQNYYEITASRLRTCTYGVDCNPVTTGSQLTENTTNIPLNFTDGLAAFDSSELSFNQPGSYTLLAHLILPSSTPTSKRYDYAVFLKVQVLSRTSATVADTTATPYAASTGDSGSSGVSTEVICVLIISGIVVVALAVIGFVTLRSKIERNPEANANKRNNSKKGRGMFGFSSTGINSAGGVAVVSDDDAEEFAMLSMHEETMRQKRGSTYLSALNRGRRSSAAPQKKNGSPIQFAGPICSQSLDRKGAMGDDDSFNAGDITPQSVTIETPGTGRGIYTGLDNTPKVLAPKLSPYDQTSAPPGQIMFNDIMEDEVDSTGPRSGGVVGAVRQPNLEDSTMSDVTDLNLTAVSERIKQHRDIAEQEAAAHGKQDVLTADDLRESETKGPMALSDLLSSRVR